MQISEAMQRRLETENLIWMTTVNAKGVPQASLVWFLWDGRQVLMYSRDSQRVVNLMQNVGVALNFNSNTAGGAVASFTGTARIDRALPPSHENAVYMAKYRNEITRIGHSPESFSDAYPVPVIVALETARGWGN